MSNVIGRNQYVPVLIIVADASIESLAGELVAFAGYRPVFDPTCGAAGESIRRERPRVALLDTALPPDVFRACIGAAREVGTSVVLTSSTASATELALRADEERCSCFALPGGPRQLKGVLDALLLVGDRECRVPAFVDDAPAEAPPPHVAFCAALVNIARSRALVDRLQRARADNRALLEAGREVMRDARRSRLALRAAVADYCAQLRHDHVSQEEALARVRDTITDCASVVGVSTEMESLLSETSHWVETAYLVA